MRVGVDTNVLIYAHLPSFDAHEVVRARLLEYLRDPDVSLVVTPLVLHELVHVVTDSRRFEKAVPMGEALALARLYLGRTNVECVDVGEKVLLAALDLLDRHQLGQKRIADTLLAATLLHHGVRRLLTANPRDFAVFEGLQVIDPTSVA